MKEIIAFFTASSKRNHTWKVTLGHHLLGLCETRWIEHHDSVLYFRDSMGKLAVALNVAVVWKVFEGASKATTLSIALSEREFMLAVVSMAELLSQTLPLGRLYQKKFVDVHTAIGAVTDTIRVLGEKRKNIENEFAILYRQAVTLADELGVEFKISHLSKKQTHRPNVETSDPVVFYRR